MTVVAPVEGTVALVTGATSGIGAAVARLLVSQGAYVVVNGRDEARGRAVIETFENPDRVQFVAGDVTKRQDCEEAVDGATAWHGRLDILVNNVGGTGGSGFVHELTDENMTGAWLLNVMAAFWTCRRARPG